MNTNQALAHPDRVAQLQRQRADLEKVTHGNFGQSRPQALSPPEIRELAELFVASENFPDVKTMAQAFVRIKAGEELGFTPFVSMSGVDIIKGKASLGADLQASLIKDSGRYRYEVKRLDAEACELVFYERMDGKWTQIGVSSFTMKDAENAGLAGKEGQNAATYRKYARNMLFSRAISNGMNWYCPDLLRSAVQREEITGFDVDTTIAETAEPEHVDGEVIEEPHVEAVEAQEPPINPETADLLIAINDEIKRLTGGDVAEIDKLLKGRNPKLMPKDALVKLLVELKDAIPF